MHVILLIFLRDVYNDPSTRSSLFLTVECLISIAKVDIRYQICSIQVALIFWQYILSISLKQSYLDFLRAVINFAVVNIFNKSHYQAVYSTPLPLFEQKTLQQGLFCLGRPIHRMQIWQTTRSTPGKSCMKARLVRLWFFCLTMFPQKILASSSMWSVSFRCAYRLLCLWMPRKGIKIFQRSPLRGNSGSMQFVETKERSSRSPWELKFVRYISG